MKVKGLISFLYCILIVLPCGCLIYCSYLAYKDSTWKSHVKETEGRLDQTYKEIALNNGNVPLHNEYSYDFSVGGQKYTGRSTFSAHDLTKMPRSEVVTVVYDPTDPTYNTLKGGGPAYRSDYYVLGTIGPLLWLIFCARTYFKAIKPEAVLELLDG